MAKTNKKIKKFSDPPKKMNQSIREEIIKKFRDKFIGFNDRGIVYYSDGLAVTNFSTPTATCRNCGASVNGKEAKEWQFGHIGCPKPNGYYLKNDFAAEDLLSGFESALSLLHSTLKKKINELDIWLPKGSMEEQISKKEAQQIIDEVMT